MTRKMLRLILELALTKLIELPPATLKSYEPWLTRKHIRFCLDHVVELSKSEEEIRELRDFRDMIHVMAKIEESQKPEC